ncbi:hypothetical protein ACHAXT_009947 [Thalassiosira profunda]
MLPPIPAKGLWLPALVAVCLSITPVQSRPEGSVACLTVDRCKNQYNTLNPGGYFYEGPNWPAKGCFRKGSNIYFGTEGTDEEMEHADLPPALERVWCEVETDAPTPSPSRAPSRGPTSSPSTSPSIDPLASGATGLGQHAIDLGMDGPSSGPATGPGTETASGEVSGDPIANYLRSPDGDEVPTAGNTPYFVLGTVLSVGVALLAMYAVKLRSTRRTTREREMDDEDELDLASEAAQENFPTYIEVDNESTGTDDRSFSFFRTIREALSDSTDIVDNTRKGKQQRSDMSTISGTTLPSRWHSNDQPASDRSAKTQSSLTRQMDTFVNPRSTEEESAKQSQEESIYERVIGSFWGQSPDESESSGYSQSQFTGDESYYSSARASRRMSSGTLFTGDSGTSRYSGDTQVIYSFTLPPAPLLTITHHLLGATPPHLTMRRRQATATSGDNGIFIIGHVESTGEKSKYGRGGRWNLCSTLMAMLGVLIITGYLMLSKAARGDEKTAARPPPPKGQGFNPPVRIPRRLIFTYKYNLLAPASGAPPMAPKDPLTANVLNTIDKYEKQWKEMDAKSGVRGKKKEEVVVSFLSDEGCVDVIQKTEPRLVDHFTRETRGDFKADICRVAELYQYGGFYFDIDIGAVEPLHDFEGFYLPSGTNNSPQFQLDQLKKRGRRALTVPTNDDIVTFASIFNGQGRFFQAFTAATPKHPVLKKALDYMVGYYRGTLEEMLPEYIIEYLKGKSKGRVPTRERPGGMGAGPFTLSIAHRSTTDEEWEEYVSSLMKEHGYERAKPPEPDGPGAKLRHSRYLYEASLESDSMREVRAFKEIPLQDAAYEKKVHWCNFVCFAGHRVYFYSRVPGSKGCPEEKRMKPPYH